MIKAQRAPTASRLIRPIIIIQPGLRHKLQSGGCVTRTCSGERISSGSWCVHYTATSLTHSLTPAIMRACIICLDTNISPLRLWNNYAGTEAHIWCPNAVSTRLLLFHFHLFIYAVWCVSAAWGFSESALFMNKCAASILARSIFSISLETRNTFLHRNGVVQK